MSEESNVQQEEQIEQSQPETDYALKYNDAIKKMQKLEKQNSDFFNELKKYKKDEKEKVEKNGNFEEILKTEREEKEQLRNEYNDFKNQYISEKIKSQAMSLANEIAVDPDAAIALTEFAKQNLSKLADENGDLSKDILESIKKEMRNNKVYARLVAGSKASGGGAPGAGSGTTGVKEMDISEYNKLAPQQKLEFSREVVSGKAQLI